jgi:K+/H+ antiporter YhaU regulatory subunit KhtT
MKIIPLIFWKIQQYKSEESRETVVMQRQQECEKKPSTTPKAIRLATISKLLEKHTIQMEKMQKMVQSIQTQTDKNRTDG